MNHGLNAIHANTEKPSRFDHFQSFVEKGGGVDGDLRPHVPGRVFERHFRCNVPEIGGGGLAERAAGCGEDEA